MLAAVTLLAAGNLQAQDQSKTETAAAPAAPVKANFSFKNAQPSSILEGLEQLYGVPFVPEVQLTERITISSGQAVPLAEAIQLLDSALRRQGATVRLEGGAVRIMPLSLAATRVEMITLKYADPANVATIVEKLFQSRDLLSDTDKKNMEAVSQLLSGADKERLALLNSKVQITAVPYPRLKAVVVRAPDAVIGAIREFIVSELDKPNPAAPAVPVAAPAAPPVPQKTRIYKLNYVPAAHVVEMALQILGITPIIETRTNMLILRTNDYSKFDELADLVNLLDVPDSIQEQTYHITLNNSTATEVKKLLDQLFQQTMQLPFTQEGIAKITEEQKEQAMQQAKQTLTAAGVADDFAANYVKSNFGVPFGSIYIVADDPNNALLIRTNAKNIPMVTSVIEQIDQPRRQVFIKVFIAEVRLDDTLAMGVDFIYKNVSGDKVMDYGFNLGARSDAATGTVGLSYSFISNNIDAFFRLIQTTSRLDVISTPNILTLNNQQAVIEFGSSVPLLQTSNITSDGVTVTTIKYEDVTTKLTVTPHINAAGYIRMDIQQDIDSIGKDTFAVTKDLQPQILITRHASTNLRVHDGQTVCLGGFIDDKIDEIDKKVPYLGDLPYVGKFFSNTSKQHTKTELLIFITPYILDTPQELLAMTNAQRQASSIANRDGQTVEEMQVRDKPRPNPYRQTGMIKNSYEVPAEFRKRFSPTYNPQPLQPAPAVPQPAPAAPKPEQKDPAKERPTVTHIAPNLKVAYSIGMPNLFGE